jgi:ribosome modulation factor
MNAPQDYRSMTADTIGKDLLQALVMELKLLPEPWPKLTKKKQDDIIDRLRNRVETNVKMAVHMLAAKGRTVVAGDLDQITIKDGVKAVVKFSTGAANLHELYEVAGKSVLVVVANAADHTGGMSDVQGEDDQRAMDLGHEYHDNDGGDMDGGDGEGEVIEGEVLGLPAPGDTTPTEEELQKSFDDGYQAAADGKPESDCPIIRSELVIEWIRGWKTWHEENAANDDSNDQKAA